MIEEVTFTPSGDTTMFTSLLADFTGGPANDFSLVQRLFGVDLTTAAVITCAALFALVGLHAWLTKKTGNTVNRSGESQA
jgi:hypothetical protein